MIAILYEESHFMLVNKPAGLLTQAVRGIDSLQVRLTEQLRTRDPNLGNPFVGLPHRLDRATSGAVLVARNQRALKQLSAQFRSRIVQKFYVAWVDGVLTGPVQHWQDYLRKVDNEPRAEIVAPDADGAKLAELLIKPIAVLEEQSVVLVRLLTGRMHQIRIQLAHRGLHVVGDQLYGRLSSNAAPERSLEERRQIPHALHALRLEFRHPTTAVAMSATAEFPDYWNQAGDLFQSSLRELYQLSAGTPKPWDIEMLRVS